MVWRMRIGMRLKIMKREEWGGRGKIVRKKKISKERVR